MSTQSNLVEIHRYLNHLEKSGNYDVEKYTHSLMFQTSQLEYFYCHLVKNKCSDDTFYRVSHKPKVHQLAYFNIGRGFPKELFDGHWCYVLQDFGYKLMIVPCTSIKETSSKINPEFELEIEMTDGKTIMHCRMQLSDIRSVDIQRLDERKQFYDVLTEREDIENYIKERMFRNE